MTGKPTANIVKRYPGILHETGSPHMVARGVYFGAVSGGRLIQYKSKGWKCLPEHIDSPVVISHILPLPIPPEYTEYWQYIERPNYRLINWSLGYDYGAQGAMANVETRVSTNVS